MADAEFDAKARAIARYVVAEMQNSGIGLSIEEATAVAAAMNSDASEFRCTNCHTPVDPTLARCPNCGSRTATTVISSDAAYRCQRCNFPIGDPELISKCPSCGHDKVVPAKSNPVRYTCASCLEPVDPSQPKCGCGSTKAYRTVER